MREILITTRFKKDLKKAKKNPRQDTDKLLLAIETLAIDGFYQKTTFPTAYLEIGNQNGNVIFGQILFMSSLLRSK